MDARILSRQRNTASVVGYSPKRKLLAAHTISGTHCSTAQHSTARHGTAQHSTAQHSTAQYSAVVGNKVFHHVSGGVD